MRRAGRRRVGILGGSFDPVHLGHLILAEAALEHLRLDRLLLMPAGRPAHKRRRALAPAEDRVAMLRLAARSNPRLEVSTLEAGGAGVTFTVRTLEALAAAEPADYFFLMGEDSLREFGTWREPGRILELARLAVARREGTPRAPLRGALRRHVVFVPMPGIELSSSAIRRRVARGASVRYWVPDAVLTYMDRHGLYRSRRTRRT
ncbi:MAG TPA: nicotinate-nucleotide adenylyltransferase [Candidatus Binatia bacterium]|nr:nicotinate-nucleotide adenylyltransferase [Candidatus Binatia bacterium]